MASHGGAQAGSGPAARSSAFSPNRRGMQHSTRRGPRWDPGTTCHGNKGLSTRGEAKATHALSQVIGDTLLASARRYALVARWVS